MHAEHRRASASQADQVWRTLFLRQVPVLERAMCTPFLEGLRRSGLGPDANPDHRGLSRRLEDLSGWRLETVPGLIPVAEFFELLRDRRFPATAWLRHPDDLEYTPAPDAFHDVLGHVPQLCSPELAETAEAVAHLARGADEARLVEVERLYWFTIEFGLVREAGDLRGLGAGLASSIAELQRALSSPEVRRIDLDLRRVMGAPFEFDHQQDVYAVAASVESLAPDVRALSS